MNINLEFIKKTQFQFLIKKLNLIFIVITVLFFWEFLFILIHFLINLIFYQKINFEEKIKIKEK